MKPLIGIDKNKEELRKHFNDRMKYLIILVLCVALLHLVAIALLVLGIDIYIPKRYEWLREVARNFG